MAIIRRLTVGIGAALLVGGWGATRYADQQVQAGTGLIWLEGYQESYGTYTPPGHLVCAAGVVSMAVGAGLIGFAVLRPTNRNDE